MFKNTNLVIKTVFENTNCLLPSKQHDRLNNRQSGHGNGPCQKSKSTHNFSIFLFTNSLKSLPLRFQRSIQVRQTGRPSLPATAQGRCGRFASRRRS